MTPVQEYLLARDMWCSVTIDKLITKPTPIALVIDRPLLADRIRVLEPTLTKSDLPTLREHLTPHVYQIVSDRIVAREYALLNPPKKVVQQDLADLPWNA